MSTASEREQILNEYGAWVEEKTLEGLDLSIEAYLDEIEAEENVELLGLAQQVIGKGFRIEFSPEAFRDWLRDTERFGADEAKALNELD